TAWLRDYRHPGKLPVWAGCATRSIEWWPRLEWGGCPAPALDNRLRRLQPRLHRFAHRLKSGASLAAPLSYSCGLRDFSFRRHGQRPLWVRLCEVCTITRPCRAQRSTASGAVSNVAERTRTFLPRNSVTAAAITHNVSGATSSADIALDFISFAPTCLTEESARASWL